MKVDTEIFWNTIVWVIMLLLIGVAYWFAESSQLKPMILLGVILVVAFIKFIAIGFQFMELKKAHPLWKYFFTIFTLLFTIILTFVY